MKMKCIFILNILVLFALNFSNANSNKTCPAIPPGLKGSIKIDTKFEKLSSVERKIRKYLLPGGWFKPSGCVSKDRVAVLIPYRNRAKQLPILLKNLHPLLMKQQIEYGIFVVEQTNVSDFNRGALMNVGFVESLKLHQWDCFIIHDVDMIAMNDHNLYNCPEPDQARHMSSAINKYKFKLINENIIGGVLALTKAQFQKANGFSNSFWAWGSEDKDMFNRIQNAGYRVVRTPIDIGRYTMLKHKQEKENPNRTVLFKSGPRRFDTDGLNSLNYEIRAIEKKLLYTWILVELKKDS